MYIEKNMLFFDASTVGGNFTTLMRESENLGHTENHFAEHKYRFITELRKFHIYENLCLKNITLLRQGYTAGRNYMCLAVTICSWP